MTVNQDELINMINCGAVGVMPTDTIYGIVASVKFPASIERIYDVKGRDDQKPFVILISDVSQLEGLGVTYDIPQKKVMGQVWPGPVSIVLPCSDEGKKYLHRGTSSLALRLPEPLWLREVISATGPIVATSANRQGNPFGTSLGQIKSEVPGLDFYIEGKVGSSSSKIIKVDTDGVTTVIR
jgi:L-threonylcarbamoyladenylate synthase